MSLTLQAMQTTQANSSLVRAYSASTFSSLDSYSLTPVSPHLMQAPIACRCTLRPRTPHTGPRQYVYAIDHASTKLRIPIGAVEPTHALEDDGLVPGVCRLHLAGRCHQGSKCYQVHADRHVIEELRAEALRQPHCCVEHGAMCCLEGFPLGLTVTLVPSRTPTRARVPAPTAATADSGGYGADAETSSGGDAAHVTNVALTAHDSGVVLSIHSLCPTNYLWRMYRENGSSNLTLPCSKICRQHRLGLCRFGDECSFLHVCRTINVGGNHSGDADGEPRGVLTMPPTSLAGGGWRKAGHGRRLPAAALGSHFGPGGAVHCSSFAAGEVDGAMASSFGLPLAGQYQLGHLPNQGRSR